MGEPSGDLHGANLIRQLKRTDSSIEFVGFGGPQMQSLGMRPLRDLTKFAVMMFWQVFLKIPTFYRFYREANRYLANNQVDAVVLIDFPGFNWWIAKAAKRHGIPVYYYGVPQMWAWAPWRIHKLKKRVDHVICKLPFEETWFRKRGVQAVYVGHPYFDELASRAVDQDFLQVYDDEHTRLLTLLPGSRDQEVQNNLDWMLEAAEEVTRKNSDVCVAIACFNQQQYQVVSQTVKQRRLPFDVMANRTPELIELADICLACSGSVSLELMFHRKPTVIVYRISTLQKFLKSIFVKVPFITLVNLFWLKEIEQPTVQVPVASSPHVPFPEFACTDNPSQPMAKQLNSWLNNEHEYRRRVEQLDQINSDVVMLGASERAASYILNSLGHLAIERHEPSVQLRRAA